MSTTYTALVFATQAALDCMRLGLETWNRERPFGTYVPILKNLQFGLEGLQKAALFTLRPRGSAHEHHRNLELHVAFMEAAAAHLTTDDRTWLGTRQTELGDLLAACGRFGQGGRFADLDTLARRLGRDLYASAGAPTDDFMALVLAVDGLEPEYSAIRRRNGEGSPLQQLVVEYVALLGRVFLRMSPSVREVHDAFTEFSRWAADHAGTAAFDAGRTTSG